MGLQVLTMRVSTHQESVQALAYQESLQLLTHALLTLAYQESVQLLTYVQVLTMRAFAVQVMVATIDIAGHE